MDLTCQSIPQFCKELKIQVKSNSNSEEERQMQGGAKPPIENCSANCVRSPPLQLKMNNTFRFPPLAPSAFASAPQY